MPVQYAQVFCSVADLLADKPASGSNDARLYQAIREASEFLQKRIGWFIPVTLTRSFLGQGATLLFVPPLLSITSIVNDDITLTTADYLLKPDDGFWTHGPYGQILVAPEATQLSSWSTEEDGVVIAGRWGMYERSASLSATVAETTEQSSSQTTLKVSDGSKVSPGMVLLIGSEQELVTGWSTPTASVTTLGANVAADDETITVASGASVNVGEVIRSTFEQMKVLDIQTNTLSVVRGWNGTRRVAHTSGAAVDVYRTVVVERGMNGTTAAAHANATAISRYLVPDDILFLTKELATLSVNKAQGGYQGRTGSTETGVVFYNDSFPKYDIKVVAGNYRIPRVR